MKKILCPVDFSAHSENAVHYACELAKKENAQILLFHAFHINLMDSNVYDSEPVVVLETGKEFEKILTVMADKVKGRYSDLKVETLFLNGLVTELIPEVIKEQEIDMIVMSTDGEKGFLSLFGTVAASIIGITTCPVWVIPGNYSYKAIKEIVYATDLHGNEAQAIEKVVSLAKLFEAHISVLNIQKEEPENVKKLIEYALKNIVDKTDYMKITFQVNEESDILQGIDSFAEKKKADVIIMATHRRNFLEKISTQSATKKMSLKTKIPLIALHKESIAQENIA